MSYVLAAAAAVMFTPYARKPDLEASLGRITDGKPP
jgi:hypothetical protein